MFEFPFEKPRVRFFGTHGPKSHGGPELRSFSKMMYHVRSQMRPSCFAGEGRFFHDAV